MIQTLNELCGEVRNWFETERHIGRFTISGGTITPSDFLQEGQFFRIVGSVFNDGIHRFSSSSLSSISDESFAGAVWAMAVPPAVIALAEEIKAFQARGDNAPTAIVSESVGGHSVTRATTANGTPATTWEHVFAKRLNRWRKL